jgi:hypothetical protein
VSFFWIINILSKRNSNWVEHFLKAGSIQLCAIKKLFLPQMHNQVNKNSRIDFFTFISLLKENLSLQQLIFTCSAKHSGQETSLLFCMRILLALLMGCAIFSTFAQNKSQYDNVFLTTANDFKRAEPQVILASDYVYSNPVEKDNAHRESAINFVMKWMQGTPDFSFPLDETLTKIAKNDYDLIGVYIACCAKYALEKGKGVSRDDIKYNSYVLLVTYCENPNNNYKIRGEVKKLADAKNQGKLKEYLESKK